MQEHSFFAGGVLLRSSWTESPASSPPSEPDSSVLAAGAWGWVQVLGRWAACVDRPAASMAASRRPADTCPQHAAHNLLPELHCWSSFITYATTVREGHCCLAGCSELAHLLWRGGRLRPWLTWCEGHMLLRRCGADEHHILPAQLQISCCLTAAGKTLYPETHTLSLPLPLCLGPSLLIHAYEHVTMGSPTSHARQALPPPTARAEPAGAAAAQPPGPSERLAALKPAAGLALLQL